MIVGRKRGEGRGGEGRGGGIGNFAYERHDGEWKGIGKGVGGEGKEKGNREGGVGECIERGLDRGGFSQTIFCF